MFEIKRERRSCHILWSVAIKALALGNKAANPRRAVEYHLNSAGLSMITGDLKAARKSIETAQEWSEKSQLWWLAADLLLAAADICIADRRPEMAWPLFEKAEYKMMGRVYALSNRGRYERLKRHHALATQGFRTMLHLSDTQELKQKCVQLTGRLEIMAFEQWAERQAGFPRGKEKDAFHELRSRQFLGVLRRLDVLGYLMD